MWGRRIALATVAAVAIAGAAAPAAWAGYQGASIYGDLNLDGLTDRVTLGGETAEACTATVELGGPNGTYGSPTSHGFAVPGADAYCPDMGVIVDLGGNGTAELVLAFFWGAPPGYPHDLLVLRDFTPVAGFRAVFQPSYIGTADFNGDGRQDVYEWTDQGDGFVTLLNTADGQLVPGPLRWCAFFVPDYQLADFDGDGGTDLLVTYPEDCADASSGVAVVHGDGTRVQLERDAEAITQWSAQVVDADDDGNPDVRTVSDTGVVSHHISQPDGTFIRAPLANDDVAIVSRTQQTVVPVLANDVTTSATRITLVTPPAYGTATVTSAGTIVYAPGKRRGSSDRLVYRLTADGRSDDAAVTIRFR